MAATDSETPTEIYLLKVSDENEVMKRTHLLEELKRRVHILERIQQVAISFLLRMPVSYINGGSRYVM